MTCLLGFSDAVLELTPEQLAKLPELDVGIVGFYFDCDLRVSGDVKLADGRWLKQDGTVHHGLRP